MFGNLRGWIIAAVLGGVLALLTYQATEFNRITPVTALANDASVLAPLSLDVSPNTIVAMDGAGDGAALYRKAIDDVRRQTARYETYAEDGTTTTTADLPAVQALLDAAPLAASPILSIDKDIGYVVESDDAKALALAAKCCERLGLLNKSIQPEMAKKCFKAEIALGSKMFDERITFYEAFDGIGMMRGGAGGLKILAREAKDDDATKNVTTFDDSTAAMTKKLDRLWTVIGSIDPGQIATHAGDIYFFATPAMKERMWRIESILKLGRYKFNASRLADSAAVRRRLAELKATEKDPAIQASVRAADNLDLGTYRSIR